MERSPLVHGSKKPGLCFQIIKLARSTIPFSRLWDLLLINYLAAKTQSDRSISVTRWAESDRSWNTSSCDQCSSYMPALIIAILNKESLFCERNVLGSADSKLWSQPNQQRFNFLGSKSLCLASHGSRGCKVCSEICIKSGTCLQWSFSITMCILMQT